MFGENSYINDSGPLYYETAMRNGLVEPWNAFSSLVYLLPVIVFLFQLYPHYSKHPFISYFASPLLFIGGVGSMLYHAFRCCDILMWLDVAPIFILTLSLGAYFLYLAYEKKMQSFVFLLLFVAIRYGGFAFFELQTAINISYFLTGVYIFIPAFLLLKKTAFLGWKQLLLSVVLFGIALFMRWYDDYYQHFFSAGTHWLWHIFSAAGAYVLGLFMLMQSSFLNTSIKKTL
jgi:hypothetical protein